MFALYPMDKNQIAVWRARVYIYVSWADKISCRFQTLLNDKPLSLHHESGIQTHKTSASDLLLLGGILSVVS